jgi:hypothetical protein
MNRLSDFGAARNWAAGGPSRSVIRRTVLVSSAVSPTFDGGGAVLRCRLSAHGALELGGTGAGSWSAAAPDEPILGVTAVLVGEGEDALAAKALAQCANVPYGEPELVRTTPQDAERALMAALASALGDAERSESQEAAALAELRTESRLQESALKRHREFVALLGVDPGGEDILVVESGGPQSWRPATGLSQRVPRLGAALRRIVVPVRPAETSFEDVPGRLDVRLVGERGGAPVTALSFSVPASRLEGGLRVPITARAAALDGLRLEIDWRGPPRAVPLIATAPSGMGDQLDLVMGSERLAGRTLAARYQATLAPIDEFPPPFTVDYASLDGEGWSAMPAGYLAYATLAHELPEGIDFSLCAYDGSAQELLVHPVSHELESWARLDGVLPPGTRAVAATVCLVEGAHSSVEFALMASAEDADFEALAAERAALPWLELQPGDRVPLTRGLTLSAQPRTLWLGTRLAAGPGRRNWYCHSSFAKIRTQW